MPLSMGGMFWPPLRNLKIIERLHDLSSCMVGVADSISLFLNVKIRTRRGA